MLSYLATSIINNRVAVINRYCTVDVKNRGVFPKNIVVSYTFPEEYIDQCWPALAWIETENRDNLIFVRAHHRAEPHHYINSHYSHLAEWIQEMERRKCIRDERRNNKYNSSSSSHHRARDRDRDRHKLNHRPVYTKGVTYRYPDVQQSRRRNSRSNER